MLIVADENIPLVDAFFSPVGDLRRLPGRKMSAEQVADADILLVRSVTEVNQSLLDGSRVRFVASATIGTDHIDHTYLARCGIGFANAPGCNANAVVDYVLSALLNLAAETGEEVHRRTVGIIGAGNVGSRLQQRLQAMGIKVLINDPPRADREQGDQQFHTLDQLLECCDTFCLHTPLTSTGPHPSLHLLDLPQLESLPNGAWLINAGRGGAINNAALSTVLGHRPDLQVVLDVWEGEPAIDSRLASQVRWGTPHIAGYSLEGRMRGTEMIYRALCDYLSIPVERVLEDILPPSEIVSVCLQGGPQSVSRRLVNLCYDIRDDHLQLMRTLPLPADQRQLAFDALRKNYPPRRDFSSVQILTVEENEAEVLSAMGFSSRVGKP